MDEPTHRQLREIATEFDADVKRAVDSQATQSRAISMGLQVAMWPAGFVFLTFAFVRRLTLPDFSNAIGGFICAGIVLTMLTSAGGFLSGWLAHRIFWDSRIPVIRMAIAFALIYDFVLVGWMFVLL